MMAEMCSLSIPLKDWIEEIYMRTTYYIDACTTVLDNIELCELKYNDKAPSDTIDFFLHKSLDQNQHLLTI